MNKVPEPNSNGFPLAGLLRRVAEGHLEEAERMLELAEHDVRLLLDGKPRTDVFKASTDPVQVLIDSATQLELCRVVIKLDDEAKEALKGGE